MQKIIVPWIFARGGEIMIFFQLYYFKEDCRLFSQEWTKPTIDFQDKGEQKHNFFSI